MIEDAQLVMIGIIMGVFKIGPIREVIVDRFLGIWCSHGVGCLAKKHGAVNRPKIKKALSTWREP